MAEEHHVDDANRLSEEIKTLVCGASATPAPVVVRSHGMAVRLGRRTTDVIVYP
jgi:hypothetical protein